MLVEEAQVIGLRGECALVRAIPASACGGCQLRGGCGTGALSGWMARWLGRRGDQLEVHNPVGARPGDAVELGIPEAVLLRGSLLLYALPLMLMLLCAIAATWLADALFSGVGQGAVAGDPAAMLGAAIGLATGFAVVRWRMLHGARAAAARPVILRVLDDRRGVVAPISIGA